MTARKVVNSMVMAGVLAAAGTALATETSSDEKQTQALKRIGSLQCVAEKAEEKSVATMKCRFERFGSGQPVAFEATLKKGGLVLQQDGRQYITMSVMAPTMEIRSEALAGSYTPEGRNKFKVAEKDNVIVGGDGDVIALEALAPNLNAFKQGSKLTLKRRRTAE